MYNKNMFSKMKGYIMTKLQAIKFRLEVVLGNRCECGGHYETVTGWNDKMVCDSCKKSIKC